MNNFRLRRLTILAALAGATAWAQQYNLSTYAGGAWPTFPAVGTSVSVGYPQAVAADGHGNVYFTSQELNGVFKLDTAGVVHVVAGSGTPSSWPVTLTGTDGGQATAAPLHGPNGIAVDTAGNLYIVETDAGVVRKVDTNGIITTVAGTGLPANALQSPSDVAVDASGNLYVSDPFRHVVKKFVGGTATVFAGGGSFSGSGVNGKPATQAYITFPSGLALDGSGNLYIADASIACQVYKVDRNGIITLVAGNGGQNPTADGGPATGSGLYDRGGLATDAAGNLYIPDILTNSIRKVDTHGIITTVAGNGALGFAGDGGQAKSATLSGPFGVAADTGGVLWIGDTSNFRVRKVDATGVITTVAGNSGWNYSGDGGPATSAGLSFVGALAMDAGGDLFIADTDNLRIRKVSPAGIITTVAGNGIFGDSGNGGPATSAEFYGPTGVAVDADGNFYIADPANNVVRKVDTSGNIGPSIAVTGTFVYVAVDAAGNLYVADSNRIRKMDKQGNITPVAGAGAPGYSGDGKLAVNALLQSPAGMVIDSSGNLFFSDLGNHCVREVNAAGVINTVAGNGTFGYSGDNGPATSAQLQFPNGVTLDAVGNLLIADLGYVRKVDKTGIITSIASGLNDAVGIVAGAGRKVWVSDLGDNVIRLLTPQIPDLTVGVTDSGLFTQGQTGAVYTITVSNAGAAPTSGTVTFVDTLPAKLTATAIAGTGWTCTLSTLTCTRTDALAAGASYPAITLTANVAVDAPLNVTDTVAVSGGGDTYPANNTAAVTTLVAGAGCTYVLHPAAMEFAAAVDTESVAVTTAPGCVWNASNPLSWITLAAPASPSGNGTVHLTAAQNTGAERTGTLTIAGLSFNVEQEEVPPVCTFTLNPAALTFLAAGGSSNVSVLAPTGCTWTASSTLSWVTLAQPASGSGNGTVAVTVPPNTGAALSGTITIAGLSFTVQQAAAPLVCTYAISPSTLTFPAAGDSDTLSVTAPAGCAWTASNPLSWITLGQPASGSGNGTVFLTAASNPGGARSGTLTIAGLSYNVQQSAFESAGARFVPVTPCRIADTRTAAGAFGGPIMAGGSSRSFAIPQSACGIPGTALAYSLNVTVVPNSELSYLTLWPSGQSQPLVSTLNSPEGAVVANAAIVPAGRAGAVSVYVTDTTHIILDIDGYFDSSDDPNSFSFYTAQPCRVADTRNAAGALGGPSLAANQSRDFPVPSSACGIPPTASAYSLNVTVVPDGFLGYLAAWPTGQGQPLVSTLNSLSGEIVSNAAIVPAGTNGSISVFATNPTDVILDANGYFAAPAGQGALSFYPVAPCRVADTRNTTGPLGGPEMEAGTARSFAIPSGGCSIPATAAAYSLNVTVVPDGPLAYLTAWPTGANQPFVSTLNSPEGSVVANAAIVPAGTGGAVSVFVTDRTHVVLDINGYFAP